MLWSCAAVRQCRLQEQSRCSGAWPDCSIGCLLQGFTIEVGPFSWLWENVIGCPLKWQNICDGCLDEHIFVWISCNFSVFIIFIGVQRKWIVSSICPQSVKYFASLKRMSGAVLMTNEFEHLRDDAAETVVSHFTPLSGSPPQCISGDGPHGYAPSIVNDKEKNNSKAFSPEQHSRKSKAICISPCICRVCAIWGLRTSTAPEGQGAGLARCLSRGNRKQYLLKIKK